MEKAILTIFFDGCPSDWLQENQSDTWHTFAYIVVPMLPTKINIPYTNMIHELNKTLPQGLGKWAGRRKKLQEKYREKFIDLFPQFWVNAGIWVNAVSFQEKELKIGKKLLLEKFSQDFLIGFRQYIGDNGKLRMRHEFVDFNGFHVIDLPENKILVLVLMAQLFVEQYLFYKKKAQEEGFDEFEMIIFSDNLSGDDAARNFSLQALSNMINPSQFETLNIQLTSSPQENHQSGDFFVDAALEVQKQSFR